MKVVRIVGFAVLVAVGVGIYVGLAPSSTKGDVSSALATAKVNELSADSAPQQQVVNGWAAKDLLAVVARQEPDNRVPALLLLGTVAVAWGFVTMSPSGGPGGLGNGGPAVAAGADTGAGAPAEASPE